MVATSIQIDKDALDARAGRLEAEDDVEVIGFDLFSGLWISAVIINIFKADAVARPRLSQGHCSPLPRARKRDRTGRI